MNDTMRTQLDTTPATDTEQRRAALYVAGRATDAADCRELLAMLGLDGEGE